jgi:hypothetical protein
MKGGYASHDPKPLVLTPEQITGLATQVGTGYVNKVTGKSLVADSEIEKLMQIPKIIVSVNAPTNPSIGDLWIDISE